MGKEAKTFLFVCLHLIMKLLSFLAVTAFDHVLVWFFKIKLFSLLPNLHSPSLSSLPITLRFSFMLTTFHDFETEILGPIYTTNTTYISENFFLSVKRKQEYLRLYTGVF